MSITQTSVRHYPSITFIIPTYQAGRDLAECLGSIFKQEYPREKIEVLVIDGGSSDNTLSIAGQYPVTVMHNPKRVAEYAKAIGIYASKGDHFVLLDSDNIIVEGDWLSRMIEPLVERPELMGVESPLSHELPLKSLDRYFALLRIADPLARMLVSAPSRIEYGPGYDILHFAPKAVLITGANGFLWNKPLVMHHEAFWGARESGESGKFEEANFATYIHEAAAANYAIPRGISVRHYYCDSLQSYIKKRTRIAGKMRNRIEHKEYIWFDKVSWLRFTLATLYLGTLLGPTLEAIYQFVRYGRSDFKWHPVVSFLTIWVYAKKTLV